MNPVPTLKAHTVRTSTVAQRSRLDHESLAQSDELLRQLTELVDGLVNLSAPFKYASSGNEPADARTAWRYSEAQVEGGTSPSSQATISSPILLPQAQ